MCVRSNNSPCSLCLRTYTGEKSTPMGMRLVVNDANAQTSSHRRLLRARVSTSGCCVTLKTPSALTHTVPICHSRVFKPHLLFFFLYFYDLNYFLKQVICNIWILKFKYTQKLVNFTAFAYEHHNFYFNFLSILHSKNYHFRISYLLG